MKHLITALLISASFHARGADGTEQFSEKLSEAAKARDVDKIMSLYDWKGVHFVFKDMTVMGWKNFIEDTGDGFELEGILWKSLEDLKPWELKMIEEWTVGENTYQLNYPAVGAFVVKFSNQDETETRSQLIFVGWNDEGKLVGVSVSLVEGEGEGKGGDKAGAASQTESSD